ncbi:hypothetical protein HAX54_025369 [Datura stramonium]|uniref:FLZ-type domain-containing protein n=1 Tax=Datura stramonium TaxID=4076 RepID=A0ABS8S675_DATST|nr:hypothetical protein [Datura stramonium]
MVGLSVVLEGDEEIGGIKRNMTCSPSFSQIVNKTSVTIKPFAANIIPKEKTICGFLESCFLCKKKLLPDRDIYMYKGDVPFCSVECRSRQIFMDEQETINKKPKHHNPIAASSSNSASCFNQMFFIAF